VGAALAKENGMNENDTKRGFRTRRAALTLGLAGLAATVVAAPLVWASKLGGRMGHGGHGFGFGHGHGPGRFLSDPVKAKAKARFAVEWALRSVGASEDQQSQARTVVEATIDDLVPLARKHGAHREEWAAAFTGPQVDRAALEHLRKSHLADADAASKRLLQGVTDLAEILTPEQRSELRTLAQRFHALHDAGPEDGR
jgi:Spy/CpxP family protein refolding chaperone